MQYIKQKSDQAPQAKQTVLKIWIMLMLGNNVDNAHFNAGIITILIKHREMKMVSDGNKNTQKVLFWYGS